MQSQTGMIQMLLFIQKKFIVREDIKLSRDLTHTIRIIQK